MTPPPATATAAPLPGYRHFARRIAGHASPLLIAHFSAMSTTIVDTIIAGYASTEHLAAIGVGATLYVVVLTTAAGCVQAITPMASHLLGAGRVSELLGAFHQALWLALAMALLGAVCLAGGTWPMRAAGVPEDVVAVGGTYLAVLAVGLPAALIFRAASSFLNAIGKPRMLMYFGVGNMAAHFVLAPVIAFGWLGTPPLGVVGSAVSGVLISFVMAALILRHVRQLCRRSNYGELFRLVAPQRRLLRELLSIGWPIGLAGFTELSCFAAIALLVAPLGEIAMGANRVLTNLGAFCYALPMTLAIATMALVGRAAGAGDAHTVRRIALTAMAMGIGVTVVSGVLLISFAQEVAALFSPHTQVQAMAVGLFTVVAINQPFNAVQAVAAQSLRGLKLTRRPMFVQLLSMWGLRLGLGWVLCFVGLPALGIGPQGLAGFWLSSVFGAIVAAGLLLTMLFAATSKLRAPEGIPQAAAA